MENLKTFLIFGGNGTIGQICANQLEKLGNVLLAEKEFNKLKTQIQDIDSFEGVVWAQGMNLRDSIFDFNDLNFQEILNANVLFIIDTLQYLVSNKKIKSGSQIVIVSSIWSQISRPEKLSYTVTKSALSGLVRSLAIDLGGLGICVNAVSPGPIESPMTRKNLSADEIDLIESQTPLKRLVTLEEVANLICAIAVGNFNGVTGQEIMIDGGWGVSKLV